LLEIDGLFADVAIDAILDVLLKARWMEGFD